MIIVTIIIAVIIALLLSSQFTDLLQSATELLNLRIMFHNYCTIFQNIPYRDTVVFDRFWSRTLAKSAMEATGL